MVFSFVNGSVKSNFPLAKDHYLNDSFEGWFKSYPFDPDTKEVLRDAYKQVGFITGITNTFLRGIELEPIIETKDEEVKVRLQKWFKSLATFDVFAHNTFRLSTLENLLLSYLLGRDVAARFYRQGDEAFIKVMGLDELTILPRTYQGVKENLTISRGSITYQGERQVEGETYYAFLLGESKGIINTSCVSLERLANTILTVSSMSLVEDATKSIFVTNAEIPDIWLNRPDAVDLTDAIGKKIIFLLGKQQSSTGLRNREGIIPQGFETPQVFTTDPTDISKILDTLQLVKGIMYLNCYLGHLAQTGGSFEVSSDSRLILRDSHHQMKEAIAGDWGSFCEELAYLFFKGMGENPPDDLIVRGECVKDKLLPSELNSLLELFRDGFLPHIDLLERMGIKNPQEVLDRLKEQDVSDVTEEAPTPDKAS